jgi:hypothetical protein
MRVFVAEGVGTAKPSAALVSDTRPSLALPSTTFDSKLGV